MSSQSESNTIATTVRCLALAHGGTMVCEVIAGEESHIGKKAFVAGLCPGEVAEVIITEDKRSFVQADLVTIHQRSAERIEAPCPFFAACGGCDLQFLPISTQRRLKREMFESTLMRQAGLTVPGGVSLLGDDLPAYGYRRRITLHLDLNGQLGFYRPGSGDVVPIDRCLLATDTLNQLIERLLTFSLTIAPAVAGIAIEEFYDDSVPVFHLRDHLSVDSTKEVEIYLKERFSLARLMRRGKIVADWHRGLSEEQQVEFATLNHFSQVNEQGNQLLIERVLEHLDDQSEITEFYAGSGNFSFALARRGKVVDAVEVDSQLVTLGSDRAVREELENLTFIQSSCERYVDSPRYRVRQSVLLDPPRSGARELAESLDPKLIEKIVYVSCALPTLARDLKILVARGFTLVNVAIVDMFAQTHHTESVSLLVR